MFLSCHILKQEPISLFRLEGCSCKEKTACRVQFPKHGVLCPGVSGWGSGYFCVLALSVGVVDTL